MRSRRVFAWLPGLALVLLQAGRAEARNPYCYNYLDRTTYDSGFSASDFSSRTDVDIVNGRLRLHTDDRKLGDTNHIVVRTTQDLKIYYLYESAGGSHTLGWFLWDDNVKKYLYPSGWNYTSQTCSSNADCDPGMSCLRYGSRRYCAYRAYWLRDDGTAGGRPNNKAYDWFEDMYIRRCPSCDPYLLRYPYSDGGPFPHIPNLLERLVSGGGGWIFYLCDDDWDTGTGGGSRPRLPPVADISRSVNSVPDYDVNGDGRLDVQDRVKELGTFDSGTELVFFHIMYYNQYMRRAGAGYPGYRRCYWKRYCRRRWRGWCVWWWWRRVCELVEDTRRVRSKIIPFFSKNVLNPDYKYSGNEYYDRDIGCGYPHWCWVGGRRYQGWLDSATLTRLRNIFGINMPHEVKRIYVRQNGRMNHMFLGAPSTDPSWWLLGFEDLYDGGDKDYNDIVFLVWRTNGGEVVSKLVSGEIPPSERNNVTITKVRIRKRDRFPPPCSSDRDRVRIDYYIAVSRDSNGDLVWLKVEFPPDSPDETTIDLQALGHTGGELYWKAVLISDNHKCHPEVLDVDIGYEALKHGEYLFTSPIVLANTMVRGTMETPASSWTGPPEERENRGHFRMYEIYNPNDPNHTINREVWDAGQQLLRRNPNSRKIYTIYRNGRLIPIVRSTGNAWLLNKVLSSADRAARRNGKPVYDLDGDGDADNDDARAILDWTRGWRIQRGGGRPQRKSWLLGAINASTPAMVHVPGKPAWLKGSDIPGSIKASFESWSQSLQDRHTIAVVGAQDGMLHAFDAGAFRWGDNPKTSVVEQRGYFEYSGSRPNYGTGREVWAFVPPSQLNNLKNNIVRDYYPEDNPRAMVDGSVAVTDVYVRNSWKTAVFFTMGRLHPYVGALDVTNTDRPKALWPQDWTDVDFHGTSAAPTAAWVNTRPGGLQWLVGVTSGLADTPSDVYLYLISAATGRTVQKVKLNGRYGRAYGVAGRPVMVDTDENGVADRIYVADTSGRVWKYDVSGSLRRVCLVASVGQPIYVTPVVALRQDQLSGQKVVTFYFGTGDRPDVEDRVQPPYYFYGFVDRSRPGQCRPAQLLYKARLPPDEKVWADAFIATDRVYVGTSTGDKAHICDEDPSNPGHIYVFDMNPGPNGTARLLANPVSAGGSVVSGVMVYDEHLFANTLGGKTLIVGGATWNNQAWTGQKTDFRTIYWQEVMP